MENSDGRRAMAIAGRRPRIKTINHKPIMGRNARTENIVNRPFEVR
jgi:hypothetical protein